VDGHDVNNLISLLRIARDMNRPVLVHVMTGKGLGYKPAENTPSKFHGVGKFDPATGNVEENAVPTFSQAFGQAMCELAQENDRVCAITAAMPGGTGLLEFKDRFPKRMFDVGIAEEHAVSMAGGLAKQGMVPVVAVYSTFLQRSYDMILQDMAMLKLHVVLGVDRAGLVGEDGETHHGLFDVGFLRHAPGLKLLCPVSCKELRAMLTWAVQEQEGPVAIRYPRGGDRGYSESDWSGEDTTVKCHRNGADVTLITYGPVLQNVMGAAELLAKQGIEATVVRLQCLSRLPVNEIAAQLSDKKHVFVVEEVSGGCGICEELSYLLGRLVPGCKVFGINLGHRYITHGSLEALYQHYGLDAEGISATVLEALHNEN
jgi:1-deoxy-D-xylulose-5-phosphate synthase